MLSFLFGVLVPKIPEFVMIGGIRWKIEVVNKIVNGGDECSGVCIYDQHLIQIARRSDENVLYSPEMLVSTLCHEIAHAALYVSGQHALMKEEQEEALVLALEHIYTPVIISLCQAQIIKKPKQ